MSFRPMVAEDLDDVVNTETRAYAFPWTRGVFADCLRVGNECHVAALNDNLIGYGIMALGAGEAHLLNVCISRDYQGFGYGRDLVGFMLDRAICCGVGTLFLEVRPSNHVAARLYESLGFREIGVRRNYYPAHTGHEDARVLAIDLSTG